MFSTLTDSNNALLVNRLGRIQGQIQALSLATREDYMAQLTSLVNRVLNEDYQMQSLELITRHTPANVGDFVLNLLQLNNDCGDLADEISRLEDNASVLFNLAAAVQNALRQQIREGIYESTAKEFVEGFIHQNQIQASTATLDFVAGLATATLIQETELSPTLTVGLNSVGSTTDSIESLQSGAAVNLFTWTGELLEILVSFPSPTVVNRLTIAPDDYKGYEITALTASPDGSLLTDILKDLGRETIILNAAAGKYSGASVIDFPARSVSSMRIVMENRVDGTTIPLRQMRLFQRSYQPTASISSKSQTSPVGAVTFTVDQLTPNPFVSIAHQISPDGASFITIKPGPVSLPVRWWYRALFSRSGTAFQAGDQPILPTTADPGYSAGFTLVSSSTTNVSPSTMERVLVVQDVTGTIPLREIPIPGTLSIRQGTVYMTPAQYALDADNNLTFPSVVTSATISYQTSSAGTTNLAVLQPYYTAVLRSVSFKKA